MSCRNNFTWSEISHFWGACMPLPALAHYLSLVLKNKILASSGMRSDHIVLVGIGMFWPKFIVASLKLQSFAICVWRSCTARVCKFMWMFREQKTDERSSTEEQIQSWAIKGWPWRNRASSKSRSRARCLCFTLCRRPFCSLVAFVFYKALSTLCN